jgi:hypothetical protein
MFVTCQRQGFDVAEFDQRRLGPSFFGIHFFTSFLERIKGKKGKEDLPALLSRSFPGTKRLGKPLVQPLSLVARPWNVNESPVPKTLLLAKVSASTFPNSVIVGSLQAFLRFISLPSFPHTIARQFENNPF